MPGGLARGVDVAVISGRSFLATGCGDDLGVECVEEEEGMFNLAMGSLEKGVRIFRGGGSESPSEESEDDEEDEEIVITSA